MISLKDLNTIGQSYFDIIIEETPFYMVLRSQKTGHYWHLLEQEPNGYLEGLGPSENHKK